jgi:hypothetical protein
MFARDLIQAAPAPFSIDGRPEFPNHSSAVFSFLFLVVFSSAPGATAGNG